MATAVEERSKDPATYAVQMASMVMARWHHSRSMYGPFFRKLPDWYNTYRGYYTSPVQSFRNNVQLPILFSTVQNDVARKVQMTFSQWPVVQMLGYGPEDAAVARKNEMLISAQMKDAQSFKKAVDFYLGADLYGTGVLQYGWKKDVRKMKVRVSAPMPTPVPVRGQNIIEQLITRYDGPDWVVRDLLDCAPATNSKFVEDMDYFITRQFLDLDQVEALAKQGFYNADVVAQLKSVGGPTSEANDEFRDRRGFQRTQMDDTRSLMDRYSKPVEVHEYWGIVPSELTPDGYPHRVITVANGKHVLRNEPNPIWLNEKPFLMYSPMPDPHFCFGPGRIEVGAKMQWTANRLASQKLDILDLIADPVLMYDKNRFRSLQELQVRAGRPIGVDGDPREAITPLSFDMRGVQLLYTEIEKLWEWIETGGGIERDTIAGGTGARRQTAREFMGRQEGSLTRLGLEGRLAEEGWIEPLANVFRALNKQFLPVPKQLKILGTGATVNPITGQPIPPEAVGTIALEDINADYDVRAVGASQMIGKSAGQQNAVLLLQAISANPIAAQTVNWVAYFRNLFMLFDFKNVDELLNSNPVMQQAAANAGQEAEGNGAQPGVVPNQPSDFAPDVLTQLQFAGKVGQNLGAQT